MLPVPAAPVDASERIMAEHARTSFNFASRFLPSAQRDAATTLYGFFRTVDDLVDEREHDAPETRIRSELEAWREWLRSGPHRIGPREPLATDLANVIETYSIPVDTFLALLDGVESDLGPRAIQDERELEIYCFQVASTVGLAMAHVLGSTSEPALRAAKQLGSAMQLTNILRDVGEDLDAGRIYLPERELNREGLTQDDLWVLRRTGPDPRFRRFMRTQIVRANERYEEGIDGIWMLPEESRYPILLAARLYQRLHTIIEQNNYDSLRVRAATSKADKVREAVTCYALVAAKHPPMVQPLEGVQGRQ
ncbi:MAG: phytoene/squalene synthase family protein [Chloroflexota bacterium]